MNAFTLAGKTIVVTGASSGIGRECAIACSQMGARVLILGRDTQRLQSTLNELNPVDGATHLSYSVDLTDTDKVDGILQEMKETIGKIDGIVHCAGISTILPLKAVSHKKMEQFFAANVFAPYQFTRGVLKNFLFSENGGSIVFLSSVMASVGETGRSLYGMSKSSLLGMSKSLAIELALRKIRVNCISPGVVVSPMSDKSIYNQDHESREKIKALHPLGFGQPSDVAHACVFLLSNASKWVTGIDMIIDGGYTAR